MGAFFLVEFLILCLCVTGDNPLVNNNRPPPADRKFVSPIIESTLEQIVPKMIDPELALMFVNCFPNTLDTTVFYNGNNTNPDTFIITGDINAMWLRDSSGQVFPYVQFATQDAKLQAMLKGVIKRQADNINVDSYANGFNKDPTKSPWDSDKRHPPMVPLLWEGKYEIDSLAWVLKLSAHYFEVTKDDSICTPSWMSAIAKIAETITYQQQSLDTMNPNDTMYYFFERQTYTQSETLLAGVGLPSRSCGLSRAGFRPSDDAHQLPFQVAGNAYANIALSQISQVLSTPGACLNHNLMQQLSNLSEQISSGLKNEAIVTHPKLGQIYAYEVDGYGSQIIMDDPNIPSLMSLPYMGYLQHTDPVYQTTRNMLLSPNNPYWFCGTAGCGIGSPHTGPNRIWPMSLIMRALTSTDDNEIIMALQTLKTTTAGKYFMHESFYKDNPNDFTRSWFAWANSMFGQLIVTLANERPYILFGV